MKTETAKLTKLQQQIVDELRAAPNGRLSTRLGVDHAFAHRFSTNATRVLVDRGIIQIGYSEAEGTYWRLL